MEYDFIYLILLIKLLCGAVFGDTDIEDLTQICIYEDAQQKSLNKNEQLKIMEECSSFEEMIRNSDIFVDKSLLVEKLIVEGSVRSVNLILQPRKWGKSMNLDMIRYFAQMELDEDGNQIPPMASNVYKFFIDGVIHDPKTGPRKLISPPKISHKKQFTRQHLANYAVIKVNLSAISIHNFSTFFEDFRLRIADAFKSHEYVESKLKGSKLTAFRRFKNCDTNDFVFLKCGVALLAEVLKQHYGQVIVLIDNYDDTFNRIYFKSSDFFFEHRQLLEYVATFYSYTFTYGIFKTAIVTGVTPFAMGEGWHNTKVYDITKMENIFPFFGLTVHEVNQLLKIQHLNDDNWKQEVFNSYGGYRIPDHLETQIFNVWSIVKSINTKKITSYWPDYKELGILSRFTKDFQIHQSLQLLMHDENATYSIEEEYFKKNYYELKSFRHLMTNENSTDIYDPERCQFFAVLYSFGYLTAAKSQPRRTVIEAVVPNSEVRTELLEFIKYTLGIGLPVLE